MASRREYCGVCEASWRDLETGADLSRASGDEMILCEVCGIWVHMRCDHLTPSIANEWADISYQCPTCRGSRPGEAFCMLPKRKPLSSVVRCGGCDRSEREIGSPLRQEALFSGSEVYQLCGLCADRCAHLPLLTYLLTYLLTLLLT